MKPGFAQGNDTIKVPLLDVEDELLNNGIDCA